MGIIPATAAEGPGAAKLDLVGPAAIIFCSGLGPFPGEDASITAPGTVDGTITTNGKGNGTIHLQEPVTGDAVQIIVDTNNVFGTPTYRATEAYKFN